MELTQIVLVCVVLLLLAYDAAALVLGGVQATISRVILEWSRKYPIIPFLCGVLCGHLFWPQR